MIETTCAWCGKTIQKLYPSQLYPRNYCNKTCLGAYRTANYTGTKAAHWKGGESKRGKNRVWWHMPWHPRAHNGYVLRAMIVAELKIGRPLASGEVVHHKDENQENDHPDNLEVLTSQADHARIHQERKMGGRWSLFYDACIECGETTRKHGAFGRCSMCSQRERARKRGKS